MNPESAPPYPQPDDAGETGEPETLSYSYTDEETGALVTVYTYRSDEPTTPLAFVHEEQNGVFVLTNPDGTHERFRDNPARHLLVEPDPQTGELRPVVKRGRPAYVWLCREERER
jgi:hypothetical protein